MHPRKRDKRDDYQQLRNAHQQTSAYGKLAEQE
jgi:hypothetical protein